VPDERDIEVVRAFVRETIRTYGIVVEDRRTGRAVERELLESAPLEFSEEGTLSASSASTPARATMGSETLACSGNNSAANGSWQDLPLTTSWAPK
jgi:hypothetical protein